MTREDQAPGFEIGEPVDQSSVTLAVVGAGLLPAAVSSLLGIDATKTVEATREPGPGAPANPYRAWFLLMRAAAPKGPDELVAQLFTALPADPAVWSQLVSSYKVQVRVDVTMKVWHRGFSLSPQSLQQLAKAGVEVLFDIHCDVYNHKGALDRDA